VIHIRNLTVTFFVLLTATVMGSPNELAENAARTGQFDITVTISELAGADSARAAADIYSPDEPITWAVYVPDSYRPEKPAGVLVYISPTKSGKIPQKWMTVMEKHNLIWVAANDSGNKTLVRHRATFALLAPKLMDKNYKINHERIYLSGFSGGGEVAGMLAAAYPSIFKGAIFICGIDALGNIPPSQLETFKQNHYVFLTGTMDQALGHTRRSYRQYVRTGVENSKLMVIPNMAHRNPDRSDIAKALRYLDSRFSSEEHDGQSNE
jgi:hypothetical protein